MSDALPTALEKPQDRFISPPVGTYNRIRSPRLAASGRQNKVRREVGKNGSVTFGERIGSEDWVQGSLPCLEM